MTTENHSEAQGISHLIIHIILNNIAPMYVSVWDAQLTSISVSNEIDVEHLKM